MPWIRRCSFEVVVFHVTPYILTSLSFRAPTDVTLKPSLGNHLRVQSPSLTLKSHIIIQLRMYYEYFSSVFCEPEISYRVDTRLQGIGSLH